MDLAFLAEVDTELQKALDAASLAGAGKLSFNVSAFATARRFAQEYALLNPSRAGALTLEENSGNSPVGHIILGIWQGNSFTPSLDGTAVNAVRCQYATQVPTSFLRLLGLTSLTAAAQSTAWVPGVLPPGACVFPAGVSACAFRTAASPGCGGALSLTVNGDSITFDPLSRALYRPILGAGEVTAADIAAVLDAAATDSCSGTLPSTGRGSGEDVATVISTRFRQAFQEKYAASSEFVLRRPSGTVAYRGRGWEMYLPVIDTGPSCGAGPGVVAGWTKIVLTQVLDRSGECAVANHWPGNPWDSRCYATKNGTAAPGSPTVVADDVGFFGYYGCPYTPTIPDPAPGTTVARVKLVR